MFKKPYLILAIIVVAAGVFFLIGTLVVRQRINNVPQKQTSTDTSQQQQTETKAEIPTPPPTSSTAGWLAYTNSKYGYSVQYPPDLKVGAISGNSVLGTFQEPVKGYHVGPLVFVSLKGDLRKQGADYFNEYYNLALNPPPSSSGEPTVACKIDKINNPTVSVKSVSCEGEGGPARYALITGTDYDVFVDGYSKGFDDTDNGELKNETDYITILATFKFKADTTAQSATPNPAPAPAQSQPVIKAFTINADDFQASPSSISVAKGTIAQITFNVSAQNVYYGGIDFRSSVVNSGTIYAGQSKTISFTANESFSFTPYWPASNVAKDYKIQVNVQ